MNNFWDKIKNSNVVKVATAYGVVCWILLQVQDAVLPTIGAPIWVAQIILFIILIGFPIACLIAWASEVNTNNEKSKLLSDDKKAIPVKNNNIYAIGGISIMIIALFAFYASPFIFDYEPKRKYSTSNNNNSNDYSIRFDLNLGDSSPNEWGLLTEIAISNDGNYVAFTINEESSSKIYLRDLRTANDPIYLTDYIWSTDVHGILKFTDDDQWVSFFDSGLLKKVRITGGATQTIMKTMLGRTSGYDIDNDRVLHTGNSDLLYFTDITSGQSNMVTKFDEMPRRIYRWPQLLPDDENIIVSSSSLVAANNDSDILLYNANTGSHETIIPNAYNARYMAETGNIIFVRDSSLWGVLFDINELKIIGDENLLVKNIETNGILGSAAYSFSRNGRLIYLSGTDVAAASADLKMDVLSRDGTLIESLAISGRFGQLSLSPMSNFLSYTKYDDSNADIWVYDFEQRISGRRTYDGASDRPRWHPDGKQIIYTTNSMTSSSTTANFGLGFAGGSIRSVSSDGTGNDKEVFNDKERFNNYVLQSISPLGNDIFFTHGGNGVKTTAYRASLDDSIEIELRSEELELTPNAGQLWWWSRVSLSNDGEWIAYVSNESGTSQLYIRPYPDIDKGKWQVSAKDAFSPIWSSENNELFFHAGNKFYRVEFKKFKNNNSSYMNLSQPEFLFEHTIVENHLTFPAWEYDSKNNRFIIISTPGSEVTEGADNVIDMLNKKITLMVVENWVSELSSIMPNQLD